MSTPAVKVIGVALAIGAFLLARPSRAAGDGTQTAKALTDLDDAFACLPLEGGGLAVATGGGLAVVAPSGAVRTLTALDGLPDTRVYALARDGDALWVGTEGGAARVAVDPVLQVSRTVAVGGAAVHVVLGTPSGLYFGTWGAGLVRLAAADAAPEIVRSSSGGSHIAALGSQGGTVFVAFADGPVSKLDGGTLVPIPLAPTHGQALLSVRARGGGEDLLLGDLEGLFRVADTATPLAPVDARSMATSADELLVATYGGGLLAGTSPGALHRVPGVPRFARGVAVRGEERCVATTEGVFVDKGFGWKKAPLGGLPSNDVTALEVNGGRVAVATFDRGAAVVEGGASRRIPGLEPTESVTSLAWQGEGNAAVLWLGTAHGLVRVAPDGSVRRLRADDGLPSSTVRALLLLPDERLLVATDLGAATVLGNQVVPVAKLTKGWTPLTSPMHATWSLARTEDGTLWLGTMSGLYAEKDGVFTRMSVATGDLQDDWVTALLAQGDEVYVGTYAGGVTRLHRSGATLEHAHLGGGCINPAGLAVAGGTLYAATMEGLLARARGNDTATWRTLRSVAPGRDVTAVRKIGDALWVGSRRGVGVM